MCTHAIPGFNPLTGLDAITKATTRATDIGKTSILPAALSVLGGIVGSVIPGVGTSLGAAAGNAIGTTYSDIGNGKSSANALGSGALAGAGNYVGGQLAGYAGNSLASSGYTNAFNSAGVGPANTIAADLGGSGSLGSYAANALPASLAGESAGGLAISTLGSYAGSKYGESLANPSKGGSSPNISLGPWASQSTMPSSLSGYAGLSPGQVSSNIATQGVYGGGEGPQEQDYFLNLINSRLNGDANTQLSPIEQSYLSQLGLGGSTSNQNLQSKLQAYQG